MGEEGVWHGMVGKSSRLHELESVGVIDSRWKSFEVVEVAEVVLVHYISTVLYISTV